MYRPVLRMTIIDRVEEEEEVANSKQNHLFAEPPINLKEEDKTKPAGLAIYYSFMSVSIGHVSS